MIGRESSSSVGGRATSRCSRLGVGLRLEDLFDGNAEEACETESGQAAPLLRRQSDSPNLAVRR
jgi:hypothetical protein